MDRAEITRLFEKYIKKLRITPAWDVRLEWIEDPSWKKTGDFKIDCDDRKAILMLNAVNPTQENIEEVSKSSDEDGNLVFTFKARLLRGRFGGEQLCLSAVFHGPGADGGGTGKMLFARIWGESGILLWQMPQWQIVQ